MTSFSRKLRRSSSKKVAKYLKKNMGEIMENAVQKKMESFGRLPSQCNVCDREFDKTDREQVFTWQLRIDDNNKIYDLYCPECFEGESKK